MTQSSSLVYWQQSTNIYCAIFYLIEIELIKLNFLLRFDNVAYTRNWFEIYFLFYSILWWNILLIRACLLFVKLKITPIFVKKNQYFQCWRKIWQHCILETFLEYISNHSKQLLLKTFFSKTNNSVRNSGFNVLHEHQLSKSPQVTRRCSGRGNISQKFYLGVIKHHTKFHSFRQKWTISCQISLTITQTALFCILYR